MIGTRTKPVLSSLGLYTDYYELTMAQGYFLSGKGQEPATFDYFFRKLPFDGGFVVFSGLGDLLELVEKFRFDTEALDYLKAQGFKDAFLQYLETFRFSADIHAMREGEIVFPFEPVVRVEGNLIETQLLETLVLNILNFESLIATKAARIRKVAGDRTFIDFGLRRAQGLGGAHASKAAVIGGASATSNVWSAKTFDLKPSGTQAHSWIQSFEEEIDAFRTFAKHYPENSILLVDTYDTLKSGIPNAIKVAKEMEEDGHQLKGIRLDSGDLAYLSKHARKMLDEAGLDYVKIVVSNQQDEYVIRSLNEQDAPIDGFGVGTSLIIGRPDAALDGVYKLCRINGQPTLKISENVEKVILPGNKQVSRYRDKKGEWQGDAIHLEDEEPPDKMIHPHNTDKSLSLKNYKPEPLLKPVVLKGEIVTESPGASESADYCQQRISELDPSYLRFENPHVYKVGISEQLLELRTSLIEERK